MNHSKLFSFIAGFASLILAGFISMLVIGFFAKSIMASQAISREGIKTQGASIVNETTRIQGARVIYQSITKAKNAQGQDGYLYTEKVCNEALGAGGWVIDNVLGFKTFSLKNLSVGSVKARKELGFKAYTSFLFEEQFSEVDLAPLPCNQGRVIHEFILPIPKEQLPKNPILQGSARTGEIKAIEVTNDNE